MNHTIKSLLLALVLLFTHTVANAANPATDLEQEVTTVELKYITGEDVLSVLSSLIDASVSVSHKDNLLIIKGAGNKTKTLLHIIKKIDSPPSSLTIEFIASNRKIDFKKSSDTLQAGKNIKQTSQSMTITERQWVSLNTGISIPIAERRRYADGTETQSFKFKKVSKNYIFKVHEFSGWSVVQVGLNVSAPSDDIAGAIEHTRLDTTIVGKTGEWLEVASSRKISSDENVKTYSTNKPNKQLIFLYVKVIKPEIQVNPNPEVSE